MLQSCPANQPPGHHGNLTMPDRHFRIALYQCHAVLDPTLTESRSDPRIGDAGLVKTV